MKKTAWLVCICFLLAVMPAWAASVPNKGTVLEKHKEKIVEKQFEVSKITITTPGVAETWRQGTTQTIDWIYNGRAGADDKVKIELFYADRFIVTLATGHPIGINRFGSFSWKIPNDLPIGAAYMIVVTSEKNAAVKATSNTVFIDKPANIPK